jgi:Bacteriophage KPP10, Structural protein ORF10
MAAPNTYSFLSIVGSIIGPGGMISLGSSAGVDPEGITIEPTEDKNTMKFGADGAIMHALHAAKPGRATVRLLKTSPINAVLSQMYNIQQLSPASWGQNTIGFRDINRGDHVTLNQSAFAKQPSIVYDVEGKYNEWVFEGILVEILGAGVPNVNTASGY